MEIQAIAKNLRSSAQKVRLVANEIRGESINYAIDQLTHSNKKTAGLVLKVLQSAIANAENNHDLDVDDLAISEVCIDEGRTIKRMKARAKGRSSRILRRTCHIKVVLTDNQEERV